MFIAVPGMKYYLEQSNHSLECSVYELACQFSFFCVSTAWYVLPLKRIFFNHTIHRQYIVIAACNHPSNNHIDVAKFRVSCTFIIPRAFLGKYPGGMSREKVFFPVRVQLPFPWYHADSSRGNIDFSIFIQTVPVEMS